MLSLLYRCHGRAKVYQAQEELFGFNVTQYAALDKLQADYEPFHVLWTTCGEFVQCVPLWQDGSLLSIDAARLSSDCARSAFSASLALGDVRLLVGAAAAGMKSGRAERSKDAGGGTLWST